MVIGEEGPVINDRVRWMALARVHTENTFSQASFFRDMRAAWNPTQEVRFRSLRANLFVVHATCLGHWERIMHQGPWIFRYWAILLHPYDGFSKAEDIQMVHMPIWL